jgi:hypothetical protein
MGIKKSELAAAVAIVVENQGTPVETALAGVDFTGAGVTTSQTAPGQVQVDVPGGGGAPGSEQSIINPCVTPAQSPYQASFGETVIVDSSQGPVIINLPPALPITDDGKFVEVKDYSGAFTQINVFPAQGGLIDNAPSHIFPFPMFGVKYRALGVGFPGGAFPNAWGIILTGPAA